MKKTFTKIALAAGFGLAMIFTISCDSAGNPSALVGHWLHESGSTKDKPGDMELFKDGTGVCDGNSISWKVENKRFILLASKQGLASDYEVSSSRLTLTDNAGKITYVNINDKNKSYQQKGTFTDSRDGKKYGTVKIGSQTWMAENLNYNADGSECKDNNEANCTKYGRLYNWSTAKTACPSGWHLPSREEWRVLVDFAGGGEIADKKLKASSGWNDEAGNGTDTYGFAALPSSAYHEGRCGYWRNSSDERVGYCNEGCGWWSPNMENHMYSVRCIQD